MASALAQEAAAGAHDQRPSIQERALLYVPYMHIESRSIPVDAEQRARIEIRGEEIAMGIAFEAVDVANGAAIAQVLEFLRLEVDRKQVAKCLG